MSTTKPKALTIRQPHASLVAVGAKTIETKSKPTSYRGPLLIHAGKAIPDPVLTLSFLPLLTDEQDLAFDDLMLGAVVASCQLVDCVPIVHTGEEGAIRTLDVDGDGALWIVDGYDDEANEFGHETVEQRDVTDQLPFGDFSPGRYAWLLDDVKPTTERCPRCWGKGSLLVPYTGPMAEPLDGVWVCCTTCAGTKERPPVPMRGRQGLWTPSADDWT